MNDNRRFIVEIDLETAGIEYNELAKNAIALGIMQNIEGNASLYKSVRIKDNTGKLLIEYKGKHENEGEEN